MNPSPSDSHSTTAQQDGPLTSKFSDFAKLADYSLMNELNSDPDARADYIDHNPREVYSGHYVPVKPTPLPDLEYIAHSERFFEELGLDKKLANDDSFQKVFSGDLSSPPTPMKNYGWATGYALSIYGTEYTAQCPFRTGNGYGDGRAISVFEGVFNGKRWEMQLKGGGQTPYCRGGDGRAVLRSSIREFLAQETMHALGIPTSRSLSLFVSKSEFVRRPWYSEQSDSFDPDIMANNPVAISTRVAPSFLRVGQIELFARRTRNNTHSQAPENLAMEELRMIVDHLITREYKDEIDRDLPFEKQIVKLALLFRERLVRLVANWIRVGYCQGNFNSDNCAAGGFTLDYGPFGFCEVFDPEFQPWTGGGKHFSFFNQPNAAQANFHMFWTALRPLLSDNSPEQKELDDIRQDFTDVMRTELESMWAHKLGLIKFDESLFKNLLQLMMQTRVDMTIFFRELSNIPVSVQELKKSFYQKSSTELDQKWQDWLITWRDEVLSENSQNLDKISEQLKQVNPKYTWREWLIAPAYKAAELGDYSIFKELQTVLNDPYGEQTKSIEDKYYQLKPTAYFNAGGISHYSCSS